jgi:hypothetical protein
MPHCRLISGEVRALPAAPARAGPQGRARRGTRRRGASPLLIQYGSIRCWPRIGLPAWASTAAASKKSSAVTVTDPCSPGLMARLSCGPDCAASAGRLSVNLAAVTRVHDQDHQMTIVQRVHDPVVLATLTARPRASPSASWLPQASGRPAAPLPLPGCARQRGGPACPTERMALGANSSVYRCEVTSPGPAPPRPARPKDRRRVRGNSSNW